MSFCSICPRKCSIDRAESAGYCGAREKAHIARAALHRWEEPIISGERGSGTVFFCGCNLNCIFCQNYKINHSVMGIEADEETLCRIMLDLQHQGAHNINLVTPAPHVPLIARTLPLARQAGLTIPVVYNTNAYENVQTLKMLEGLIDIYLPDFKYVSSSLAKKYSDAEDYFAIAAQAIAEMYRQVGNIKLDENGMAASGVLIRHMVLPGCVDDTRRVLDYVSANYPKNVYISIMSQYAPPKDDLPKPINRRITKGEYDRALDYAISKGFENVFIQQRNSADLSYTPDFDADVIFDPIKRA